MADAADSARAIADLVEATPFVDTHEHLLEESWRLEALASPEGKKGAVCDFSILFSHYAESDLIVAGLSQNDLNRICETRISPKKKFRMLAPYYAAARHTGYLRNVRNRCAFSTARTT